MAKYEKSPRNILRYLNLFQNNSQAFHSFNPKLKRSEITVKWESLRKEETLHLEKKN